MHSNGVQGKRACQEIGCRSAPTKPAHIHCMFRLSCAELSNRDVSKLRTDAPFKVSEFSMNFPPSISLKSGAAVGLSVLTGPSADARHIVGHHNLLL